MLSLKSNASTYNEDNTSLCVEHTGKYYDSGDVFLLLSLALAIMYFCECLLGAQLRCSILIAGSTDGTTTLREGLHEALPFLAFGLIYNR